MNAGKPPGGGHCDTTAVNVLFLTIDVLLQIKAVYLLSFQSKGQLAYSYITHLNRIVVEINVTCTSMSLRTSDH